MSTCNLKSVGILAIALCITGITSAHAAIVSLSNTVMIEGAMTWEQDLSNLNNSATGNAMDNGDGSSTYMGMDSLSMMVNGSQMPLWDYSWNITADPDPFIAGSFSVTNTSAMMQTFDITFSLPISPSFTDGFMTGSLSGSFFDADNSGSATLNLNAWDGLIDGSTQMTLFLFSGACSGSAGCNSTIAPVSQGPTLYIGDVNSTIGIHMNFDLSAGDTATFDTLFEVNPIPVPAAVWLFGTGLLGLVGVARRKA